MEDRKKYLIVEDWDGCSKLEERVSELMSQGYKPHGSLVVLRPSDNCDYFYQAMVLDDSPAVEVSWIDEQMKELDL